MSIMTISLATGGPGEAELEDLVAAATRAYAASLGWPVERVCVLVERHAGDARAAPRVEFLIPDGTPLAESDERVGALKRRLTALTRAYAVDAATARLH